MFEIGWGELVLIGLVALIVIGPKELPTVLRTAGQWMGKAKRMASEFQGQFQEALREAEVADLKEHAEALTGELKSITEYDPLADGDKDKDETEAADWDEPPYETPEHEETSAHEEPAAETALEPEKTADGSGQPAAAPVTEPVAEPVAETEPAPAVPVATVESAPVEAAEGAPPAGTPPPKQAGGTA